MGWTNRGTIMNTATLTQARPVAYNLMDEAIGAISRAQSSPRGQWGSSLFQASEALSLARDAFNRVVPTESGLSLLLGQDVTRLAWRGGWAGTIVQLASNPKIADVEVLKIIGTSLEHASQALTHLV